MKKVFKIIGFALLFIVVLLIAAPFIFEAQLKDLVKKSMNDSVDAAVDFSDLDLSLFRSFPEATLIIKDVSIINNAPFEGDTLAFGEEVLLKMSINELFKSSDKPKKLDEIRLNNVFLNMKVDSLGNNNYDIVIEDPKDPEKKDSATAFSFDLKHYEINDSKIQFLDETNNLKLFLEDVNHSGTGDFSLASSELTTETEALISLEYDSINYLDKNLLALDAIIQMDLENMKYSFLENEATINQLPLTFDGYVKVNEDNNEIDLKFKTPSSDFKNFLAVMPKTYARNIENVDTQGNFIVDGTIKGIVDDTYIPTMDIKVSSNNASFKYPDLPKSVQNINIDLQVLNETGIAEDTYISFDNVTFQIDQDKFTTSGKIRNLTENMLVDLALKGTINLANIKKAYPLEIEQDLNGILNADLVTNFDMNSIEKELYQNVNSKGSASIRDFKYNSPEFPNEIHIPSARFTFNQGNVSVPDLKLTTGQTDLAAIGTINNLMGFLFTKQQLKGDFQVTSNTFALSDFKVAETESTNEDAPADKKPKKTTNKESIKIPSFLDARVAFSINKLLYDDLVLNNTKGVIIIKDETASLQNVTSNIFDGNIALNGNVSTKATTPSFKMDLNLNALDIAQSFNGLELLQNLTPLAKALEGKLQTTLNLQGNLNDDLTPMLTSLAGNALAEILTAKVDPEKMPLLTMLDQRLNFIDFKNINLDKLKTQFTFNDGSVEIKPFTYNIKGIDVTVAGSHSFNMDMDYNLNLDVPAKYLGNQLGETIGKLSGEEIDAMMVKLPIGLTGKFQSPKINLNMDKAVSDLSQKIVAQQKDKYLQKGLDRMNAILGNKNPKTADSTKVNDSTTVVTPPKKDSISTPEKKLEDAAKNILGGILRDKKKKTDTTSNQ